MKKILILLLLMCMAGTAVAQEHMADRLRKAIIEEEAGRNLDKAIAAYNDILRQYDEHRIMAATALFHLADCYRKQGKKEPAIAAYQRLLREFPEQVELADASRNYLASTYNIHSQQDNVAEKQAGGIAQQLEAMMTGAMRDEAIRKMELEAINTRIEMTKRNIGLIKRQIAETRAAVETGTVSPTEIFPLEREHLSLQERLEEMKIRLKYFEEGL